MGDVVSRKKLFINYSGGNYQLKRVKSGSVTHEGSTDVVLAMGVQGGAGFRDKEGGGEISLEVYRETGNPEVNWRRLRTSREVFSLVTQDEDGMREQYRSCRVAGIPDSKFGDDGEIMDTVKIKFLQSSQLNATTP